MSASLVMAFIGLKVPHETARLLSEIEVPGQREAASALHITMFYLGTQVAIDDLAEVMKATFEGVQAQGPFTVRTSLVTCFPKGDDGVPIICRVESDALHELRDRLRATFKAKDVPFNDKYPEYKPHVTLAYAADPIEDRSLPTVEWGAHELVMWGGDEGDQRLVITFPFSLNLEQRVARRFLATAG